MDDSFSSTMKDVDVIVGLTSLVSLIFIAIV